MSSKLKLVVLRKIIDVYHTPKHSFSAEKFSTNYWNDDVIWGFPSVLLTSPANGNNWDITESLINHLP